MKAGTTFTKKQYKFYYRLYLVTGIIFLILGLFFAIPVLPFGVAVLLVAAFLLYQARYFKKSSIEGGHPKEVEEFVSTSRIGGYIEFNDNTKQVLISPKYDPRIINYSDILSFELIENRGSVVTKSEHDESFFGRDTTKQEIKTKIERMRVKILVKDMNNPNAYIDLIDSPITTDSSSYQSSYDLAQKILSMLQIATSQKDNINN